MDLQKTLDKGRQSMASIGIRLPFSKARDLTCFLAFGLASNSATALAKKGELIARPAGWQDVIDLSVRYRLPLQPVMQLARSVNAGCIGTSGLPTRVAGHMVAGGVLFGSDGWHSLTGMPNEGWYELTSREAISGGFEKFFSSLQHLCDVTVWLGTDSSELVHAGVYRRDHGVDGLDDEPWELAERFLTEADSEELEDEFVLYKPDSFTRVQAKAAWARLRESLED